MSCKGLCDGIQKESIRGYDKGQRYCRECNYYIKTDELFCKCCHKMYRRSKRYNKLVIVIA